MTRAKSVQTVTGARHHRHYRTHYHQTTAHPHAQAHSHPDTHSPTMAWALYLSNTSAASVTDAQLAELDDFELVRRTAAAYATAAHLHQRIGHIVHALICAAGAVNSRSHMLRSVGLLHALLTDADPVLLRTAVRGVISQSLTTTATALADHHHHLHNTVSTDGGGGGSYDDDEQAQALAQQDPPFLRPLVSIAVNRVSDGQLSSAATHCLAILLGNPVLDEPAVVPPPLRAQTAVQTRRLVAHLITQVVLTASPAALESLARLLRRDRARIAFCHKDGVSTLASTLRTTPDVPYTAIGAEVVGTAPVAAATLAADSLELHCIGKTGPTGRISSSNSSSSSNNHTATDVSNRHFIGRTTGNTATSHATIPSRNVNANNVYNFNSHNSPVYASYHAVFAVWMLSFASRPAVVRTVLQHVVEARLIVTLANLLSHASGQRLKIARVTLASLRNLAVGPRDQQQQQHATLSDAPTGTAIGDNGHGPDDTTSDYYDLEDTDEDCLAIAHSTKNRGIAQQHDDKRTNGSSLTRSVSSSTNSTSTSTSTSSGLSQALCAPRCRPAPPKTSTNRPQSIDALRKCVRRDLLAAQVPTVLQRLMRMASVQGSLMGSDADAVADVRVLLHALDVERESMSTLDEYAAQVRAGTLSLSSSAVHDDPAFWTRHAAALAETRPDVLRQLFAIVCGPGSGKKENGHVNGNGTINEDDYDDDDDDDEDDDDDVDVDVDDDDDDESDMKKHARRRRRRREQEPRGQQQQQDMQADATTRAIACTHLAHVMRYAPAGKQAILRHAPQLKGALMQVLATEQTPAVLKNAALICMQTLLVHHSLRR